MKKFRFTLETVLSQEKRQEKAQLRELADIREKLRGAIHRRDEISDTISRICAGSGSGMTVDEFRQRNIYINELITLRNQQDHIIKGIQEQERNQIFILQETRKRIKVLDKLREKQYDQYQAAVMKEEEKALEEMMAFKLVCDES